MAIITTNFITENLRGRVGNVVFRQMFGKTIVSSKPHAPRKQSALQKETRSRFQEASRWAKKQMCDPEKKAHYKQQADELKLPNAYTAAIRDYMRQHK